MAWAVLIASGLFETVWAAALAESRWFSRVTPIVVFALAMIVSMVGLAYALRELPIGTAYAVWVGVGAVGTAVYGMVALDEVVSVARILCLVLIVSGIAGLKVLHG